MHGLQKLACCLHLLWLLCTESQFNTWTAEHGLQGQHLIFFLVQLRLSVVQHITTCLLIPFPSTGVNLQYLLTRTSSHQTCGAGAQGMGMSEAGRFFYKSQMSTSPASRLTALLGQVHTLPSEQSIYFTASPFSSPLCPTSSSAETHCFWGK